MREAAEPRAEEVSEAYLSLPQATFVDVANKATMLTKFGQFDRALAYSTKAVQMAPDNPAIQNNHCDLLVQSADSYAAAPYCKMRFNLRPQLQRFGTQKRR
jgi:Tfp pilus assembly protein PilF